MNGALLAGLSGLTALLGAATGIASVLVVRRGQKETAKAKDRIDAFEIMEGLVEALRNRVADCDGEITRLNSDLKEGQVMATRLSAELSVALANVGLLTTELTNHGVPIPPLRRVS